MPAAHESTAWTEPVVSHLRGEGGLLAYPTETVYGLGSLPHPEPLRRLAEVKGRQEDKPFLLLVKGWEDAEELRWTAAAHRLARRFWPGPLTLVLADPGERFPQGLRGPGGGVAVRVSPRREVSVLLDALGEPLTSTSANRSGEPPLVDPGEVIRLLTALGEAGGPWLFVDGGVLPPSPPSTVVDCTEDEPRILRWGAVSPERLNPVVWETHE